MTLPCTCVFVCKQCSSSFRTNVYGACSPLHFRLRCFPAYCRRTCFHATVRKSVPLSQNRNRTYSTKYNILQRSLHLPCPPLLFPINLFPFLKQYAQVHIDQLNNNKQSKTDRRLPRTFDKMLPKTFSTPLTSAPHRRARGGRPHNYGRPPHAGLVGALSDLKALAKLVACDDAQIAERLTQDVFVVDGADFSFTDGQTQQSALNDAFIAIRSSLTDRQRCGAARNPTQRVDGGVPHGAP